MHLPSHPVPREACGAAFMREFDDPCPVREGMMSQAACRAEGSAL